MGIVTSKEFWQWPETQALMCRLGIHELSIVEFELRARVNELVEVEITLHATEDDDK